MDYDIDELREEATSLGIAFNANIGAAKLKERIDEHYAALEAAEPSVVPEVRAEAVEAEVPQFQADGTRKLSLRERAAIKARKARATRIVTVVDNDQRINNQTTTCVVNCSNSYFDLGTVYIPLNEKVEVSQGHINVLLGVEIPQHQRDPNNAQLSVTIMRPRYSITYHDELKTKA